MKLDTQMIQMLSIASAIIAFISLIVSISVAWMTRFKPANLITLISRIDIWERNESDNNSAFGKKILIPYFWIRNLGAKPAIISDIRISIELENGNVVRAKPESEINISTLFEDSNFTFFEKDKESFPIDLEKLFSGFSLTARETWESKYYFYIKDNEYHMLKGKSILKTQVKLFKNDKWKTIDSVSIDFEDRLSERESRDKGYTIRSFRPEAI